MIGLSRLLRVMIVIAAVLAPSADAAQSAPLAKVDATPTSVPSSNQLEGLVRTLQSPEQRTKLIAEIEGLIAAEKSAEHKGASPAAARPGQFKVGGTFAAFLAHQVDAIGREISAVAGAAKFSQLSQWAREIVTRPEMRLKWLEGTLTVIGVLGLAILARRGTDAALGAIRRSIRATPSSSIWTKGSALLIEILLRWATVLVFLAAGYSLLVVALAIAPPQQGIRICLIAILQAYATVRAILIVVAVGLERAVAGTGVFQLDEETSDYWLVWLTRLVRFSVYSYFFIGAARAIGIADGLTAILVKALGLVFAGLLIMLLLQNRARVARLLRGRAPQEQGSRVHALRDGFAAIWHVAAILYIVGGFATWAADIPGEFVSLVKASMFSVAVLIAARFGALAGTRMVNRLLAVPPALASRLPDLQIRVNLYAPAMLRIARGLVYLIAGLLVLQIWGVSVLGWLASPAGLRLVGALLVILLTSAVAILTWEAVGFAINLYLLAPAADGTPAERSARTRTLLPLFRKTLALVLSAAVALVVLSELGVNVTPLLAGAGIIGIAVGFGAQTLVKDIVNGLFILMQDAVAVGDVVSVAGSSGLVEEISIRSIRLRGLDGTVIIVPFSEVATVQNMTKDFSYALFNIGVSYREDVDEVIQVVTAIADELYADPEHRWRILEPIEILGLDQFADSAVIIKARIKTKPIQQWNVMREYNKRLKRRFDELGIEMPFPHRTIYFGVDKKGDAPPAHVVSSQMGEAAVVPIRKRRKSPVSP